MNKKDIKLFLVLIPLINVINYYLTYPHIDLSWHTAITFTIDTLEGYLAWLTVRKAILFLNRRLPFSEGVFRRILVQLLLTTVSGMTVIISLTWLTNILGSSKPIPRTFFTEDIFIFLIWFFVVNGIYISLYYYDLWQLTEKLSLGQQEKIAELTRVPAGGMIVKTGKQTQQISYDRIAGFQFENEYAFVMTTGGEKFIVDGSLDQIEKTLPEKLFFRINRQLLINRQMVGSYKKLVNGKLNVSFQPLQDFAMEAQVSRTKSPAFKRWFQEAHHAATPQG